jgi:hypothetical protein
MSTKFFIFQIYLLFFFFFSVLRIEPRALQMLEKWSTTELYHQLPALILA